MNSREMVFPLPCTSHIHFGFSTFFFILQALQVEFPLELLPQIHVSLHRNGNIKPGNAFDVEGRKNSGSRKSRRVFFSILNKPRGSNVPVSAAPFWLLLVLQVLFGSSRLFCSLLQRVRWLSGCQTTSTSSSAWRLIFSQFSGSFRLLREHILLGPARFFRLFQLLLLLLVLLLLLTHDVGV